MKNIRRYITLVLAFLLCAVNIFTAFGGFGDINKVENTVYSGDNKTVIYPENSTVKTDYVLIYKRKSGNTWVKTKCDAVLPLLYYKDKKRQYNGSEVSWDSKGRKRAIWAYAYYDTTYHNIKFNTCTAYSDAYLAPASSVKVGDSPIGTYGVYTENAVTVDNFNKDARDYYNLMGIYALNWGEGDNWEEASIDSFMDGSPDQGREAMNIYQILFDMVRYLKDHDSDLVANIKKSANTSNLYGAIYYILDDMYSGRKNIRIDDAYAISDIKQLTEYDIRYIDHLAYEVFPDLEAFKDPSGEQGNQGNAQDGTQDTASGINWTNWYTAAYKVMSGATEGWDTLGDEYQTVQALLEADNDNSYNHWQRVFDVISLAYSGNTEQCEAGTVKLSEWDIDMSGLKQSLMELQRTQGDYGGLIDGADTIYQPLLEEVKGVLTSTTGNSDIARLQTIRQRLLLLYMGVARGNADTTQPEYTWLNDFYKTNVEIFAPGEAIFKDGGPEQLLTFSGTTAKSFPRIAPEITVESDLPYKLPAYLLQTVWEVGYIRDFMIEEMNERILNSTILDNKMYYDALKNIHQAVAELGMPVLTMMWEQDTTKDVQYKSLKTLYEACLKDAKVQEFENSDIVSEDKTLHTGKPLPAFFINYTDDKKLTDNYLKGIAYTATLVPMKSNLYSAEWLNYLDSDFRTEFYDLYGYNRKALYRDITAGAGEEYFNSGEVARGTLDVCTLRDLIQSKGDIVLYLDDNFYNAKELRDSQVVKPTYPDKTQSTDGNSEVNVEWYSNIASGIEDTYNTNFDNIAKTNESLSYSKIYYNMMNNLPSAHVYYPEATPDNPGNSDSAVLSSGKINYYLNPNQDGSEIYSPLQGYAVISSVYRDGDLFNLANSIETHKPVFVSSPTAPYAKGASMSQKVTLYNYALIRNLEESMPVGYLGNLDMDCPIYMDILGNIVTESGTVVVPAMSNATLMSARTFTDSNWAAGLYSIYGNGYRIPVKKNDSETVAAVLGNFVVDDSGKHYVPKARTLGDDYTIDMSRLATTSRETLDILYNRAYADLKNSENTIYNFHQYFQIATEVLRGAPIEYIDKTVEGLSTNNRLNKAGLVAAVKLEDLNKSLTTDGENSTISMPSIAFLPGFNYIAVIVFKALLLAIIVINMAIVYIDAVGGHLGLHTIWKCFSAMVITVLVVLTIPSIFEITYYQSNKSLLQKEAAYISMLNLEKKESGVEIGITEVNEPDISSELFIKLEDIQIPWYELFYNSIFTESYKTINEMYENYAQNTAFVASEDDVLVRNDGVYVSTDSIYSSSAVDLQITGASSMKNLVQTAVNKNSTFGFYSPYYVILDALIQNVNYFNANPWGDESREDLEGWYAYTTKTQKGGRIKTMGLVEPYFTSAAFMEESGKDLTGMGAVYADNIDNGYVPDPATYNMYNPMNMVAIQNSYWYASDISRVECTKRVEYLNKQARIFVTDNKELLGKISDETFLKVMALYLATKHNEAFGAEKASAVEIYNLSNDDLIRMSIAKRSDVMLNSTLSYPRFIYSVGGTSSVFAAALFSMVMWISSIVKPVLVIVAFFTIFVSIFIFKICLRKDTTSLYGYFITTLLLCGTNILYSVLLKLSMYLPSIGMTPFMCILIQIVVQIVYMVILLQVVGTAFRDWRDLGAQRYANKFEDVKIGLFQKLHRDKGSTQNAFYGGTTMKSDPEKNWSYYDAMMEERRNRTK